jgi:ATP-dependent DNA helicase RecQ
MQVIGNIKIFHRLLAKSIKHLHRLKFYQLLALVMDEKNQNQRATEAALKNQDIKVLFVAPERLQNAYFLSFLKSIKIAFFAVDEAHCEAATVISGKFVFNKPNSR